MAIKQIIWNSTTLLPCMCEANARVMLCITEELSASAPLGFIEATLASSCRSSYKNKIAYTFVYDDAQIAEGETLTASDITGAFCRDCLTDWVEAVVAATS